MTNKPAQDHQNGLQEGQEALLKAARLPHGQNPAIVFLGRLSAGSRRTMNQSLNVIAGILSCDRCTAITLDWPAIRYQHVAVVRQALAEQYSAATANKMLSALRGVLREAWRLGHISAEEYERAADVQGIKAETLPRGRSLGGGELRAIFDVCAKDPSAAGARDAALLAVLYGAGLRRSEAVSLTIGQYDRETGALTVSNGKGRKDRVGYATNGSHEALEAWLSIRGDDAGPLLCPVNKAGRVMLRKMTDQAVLYILRRRAAEAGVSSFSPHDLRRSFISDLLDAGADHVTAAMTEHYSHVDAGEKKAAAEGMLKLVKLPPKLPKA